MTSIVKFAQATHWGPLCLVGAVLCLGAQSSAAWAEDGGSRLFYSVPGPGAASLGPDAAPVEQPAELAAGVVRRQHIHRAQMESRLAHPHHQQLAEAERKPALAHEMRVRHAMHRPNSQVQ